MIKMKGEPVKVKVKGRPRRLAFVNPKGGVGKTTLAINIASELQNKKRKEKGDSEGLFISLVDNDPQGGAVTANMAIAKHSERLPITNEVGALQEFTFKCADTRQGAEYIIVDGACGIQDDPRLKACLDMFNRLRDRVDNEMRSEITQFLYQTFGGTHAEQIENKNTTLIKIVDLVLVPVGPTHQEVKPSMELLKNIKQLNDITQKPMFAAVLNKTKHNEKQYIQDMIEYMESNGIPYAETRIGLRTSIEGNVLEHKSSDKKGLKEIQSLVEEIEQVFEEE